MRNRFNKYVILVLTVLLSQQLYAQRYMEFLDRGLVAVRTSDNSAFLSWRLLATDDYGLAFDVYRQYADGEKVKINATPLTLGTNIEDKEVDFTQQVTYYLTRAAERVEQPEATYTLSQNHPVQQYLEIPLRTPTGYTPGDVSVGDLDGDGEYEIIIHQTGVAKDNAHNGLTSDAILQAYKLDGTFLWEINLGKNIREGAHYTQFMVYDLDNDGRAELVCKTADGTKDGRGNYIGDPTKDWRDTVASSGTFGRILKGDEFLTVFDGLTGEALHTVPYIPERGDLRAWGAVATGGRTDNNGNRADRFLACVAYLDGENPSVVMARGYYNRSVLVAWDFKDKKLQQRWIFDSKDSRNPYSGQGNHNLTVADVDGDGRDEIIYGSMTIDDDGSGLYTTGLGHGDAMHVSDLDPDRPGLEVFAIHEKNKIGATLRDAGTGEILFKGAINQDVGRGAAANIDPDHRGAYMWWSGSDQVYDTKGNPVGPSPRFANFLIWWDGDLSRELLNANAIDKYNQGRIFTAEGASSINGTKSTPNLSADIFGDWREELLLRSDDNQSLRIYTTTIPTEHRLYTLMHDPQYRLSVAWQNVAYNQPPHTSYYLGTGMDLPAAPEIKIVKPERANGVKAPKPLYRDPIEDGAADPVILWNKKAKKWNMFYTNRRAKSPALSGVAWVHGTAIGIAESTDGVHWEYIGEAEFHSPDKAQTLWAPDIIEHEGTYHMYLTVVRGIFEDWQHPRYIEHFTSKDLKNWDYQSTLTLFTDKVIDAGVLPLPQGGWRMWYNNERDGKSIYYADSKDLYHWEDKGKAIDTRGEGPKPFHWNNKYWMVVDTWKGLAVFSSDDLEIWDKQEKLILDRPGLGADDGVVGNHPDVLIHQGRSYIYYFTHPGKTEENKGKDGYEQRRSSIQVAELVYENGEIQCHRDQPVFVDMRMDKR